MKGLILKVLTQSWHNVEKWPNTLLKSCSVHTARFLNPIWPFFHIMHESLNQLATIVIWFSLGNNYTKLILICQRITV